MNWNRIRELAEDETTIFTKRGKPFYVATVSDTALIVKVSTGREYDISRKNLEYAEQLLRQGESLTGPKEYADKVYDQRPVYAWAILCELGYFDKTQ